MVYVDELKPCAPHEKWKFTESCHLYADSNEELHRFARNIGLKEAWFQVTRLPHYDLTVGKRKRAVAMGAKEVSDRFTATFIKERCGDSDSNG